MTRGAGVRRDELSLGGALGAISRVDRAIGDDPSVEASELRNLVDVARTIVLAAWAREETRGAHTREDFPETAPDLRARFLHGT